MSLQKFLLGKNEDGSPHYLYVSDDPSKPVVLTGSVIGDVTTSDGTKYNVSEAVIEVEAGHNGEIAHLIGMRYETEGHPKDAAFIHTCDDHCGVLTIKDKLAGGPLAAKRGLTAEEQADAAVAPASKGGRR